MKLREEQIVMLGMFALVVAAGLMILVTVLMSSEIPGG